MESFYITTTLPYVNSKPHIGFAMELVRADTVARYKELLGYDVFFNTGVDEHGSKIYEKAQQQGIQPQEYVDEAVKPFEDLIRLLNIKEAHHFSRTTSAQHKKAAQAFWKLCEKDIYKDTYQVKYCVGCELEKTDSELVDGRCPLHPNREIELREEENYYFAFSKYQKKLLEFYDNNPHFIVPDYRMKEMRQFIQQGLQDFSISRLKEKMPWGVSVPGDDTHVMYVWFDALINYISALGWPDDQERYEKYWVKGTPVQYAGKDNLRQQSAMWQAMLMSAGLSPSSRVVIDGFITSGGQKMSKSLGNVIDPLEWISKRGTDALRYYVIREIHPFEDSDATEEKMIEAYNANLANGIGNCASRIMKMAVSYECDTPTTPSFIETVKKYPRYKEAFDSFKLNEALDVIWSQIQYIDEMIAQKEPFKKIKIHPEEARKDVYEMTAHLFDIAVLLEPFMPETSHAIQKAIEMKKSFEVPLFLRIDA